MNRETPSDDEENQSKRSHLIINFFEENVACPVDNFNWNHKCVDESPRTNEEGSVAEHSIDEEAVKLDVQGCSKDSRFPSKPHGDVFIAATAKRPWLVILIYSDFFQLIQRIEYSDKAKPYCKPENCDVKVRRLSHNMHLLDKMTNALLKRDSPHAILWFVLVTK